MNYSLFISCPKGMEYLLEEEVKALGLQVSRVNPQGVYGEGNINVLYNLCLWSRLANRVQLILFSGQAHNEQTITQLTAQFPWQTVFSADKTLAVEFHGSSEKIRNTMYGAQLVKDGVVDHFRKLTGTRPSVDKENPQIRLHAYLKYDELTLSFDLTGYSLHQRGYRSQAGSAPLKENLAAALLLRSKWPELAQKGYALHDPFCGSGTIVIEAAMMAAHIAPGLIRQDQSLNHWAQHQPSLWDKLRHHALQQVKPLSQPLLGTDPDPKVIAIAQQNAKHAGVAQLVEFRVEDLSAIKSQQPQGLVICNPPYGERLGEPMELVPLYQKLGEVLYHQFQNWQAMVLTANPLLAKAIGLRSTKQYTFFNGALECKLYSFILDPANELKGQEKATLSSGAQMLMNRLSKKYGQLTKWAKKNNISCYRLYDADLPEYNFAIDIYNDYAVLQEYKAPAEIPAHKIEKRNLDVIQVIPQVLPIPASHLVLKKREQQKGTKQYQKQSKTNKTITVTEGSAKFLVNLWDYLDTGLFLDHRPLRLKFAETPKGSRFLNLFCYTATASIHAALSGAHTTNVDMSNTYLQWAENNFKLNQLSLRDHQFVAADVLEWLKKAREHHYDVIFLDPPSFSNSKKMSGVLDIQRDHAWLIRATMRLLSSGGTLYFSTNFRQFKLDPELLNEYSIKNISAQTLDQDFKRNTKIHYCFEITTLSNG